MVRIKPGKKPLAVTRKSGAAAASLSTQFNGAGARLTVCPKGSAGGDLITVRVSPGTFRALGAAPRQRVLVQEDNGKKSDTAGVRVGRLLPSNALESEQLLLPAAWMVGQAGATNPALQAADPPIPPGTRVLLRALSDELFCVAAATAVPAAAVTDDTASAAAPPQQPLACLIVPVLKTLLCGRVFSVRAGAAASSVSVTAEVLGRAYRYDVSWMVEARRDEALYAFSEETALELEVEVETDAAATPAASAEKETCDVVGAADILAWAGDAGAADATRGVVYHGVHGVGKSFAVEGLVRTLKKRGWQTCVHRSGCLPPSPAAEEVLRRYAEGSVRGNLVVTLDEMTACVQANASASSEAGHLESRLCEALDGVRGGIGGHRGGKLLVLGVAASPADVPATLRRQGRMAVEVEVAAPCNAGERAALFESILVNNGWTAVQIAAVSEGVKEMSVSTHGFLAADLLSVYTMAEARCRKDGVLEGLFGAAHIVEAARHVRPSSLKSLEVSIPCVRWTDVGGQQEAKRLLAECVEWPLKYAEMFSLLSLKPPSGILLYGPPGCSKTLLAKALATECSYNFIAVKGPELYNKWVGESEKAVRDVFSKARAVAPAILFFDEVDGMCGRRGGGGVSDRVISQFLTEMDGLPGQSMQRTNQVVVLAATNCPDNIDPALLRPGRIDRRVYIGLPDDATREDICRIALRGVPVADNVDVKKFAAALAGRSGAEVVSSVKEGVLFCLGRNAKADVVDMRDLLRGAQKVLPRTNLQDLDFYKKWGAT